MEMLVDPQGVVRCLYGEEIDLAAMGRLSIARVSLVEPDESGRWWADLAPAAGPKLGPFARRSEALAAEAAWLAEHRLCRPADAGLASRRPAHDQTT